MSPLDAWRRELRGLISRGFLRRDQGDGLLVSDYPRHCGEADVTASLIQAGYTVDIRDGLAYLDGTTEKYCALAAAFTDGTACPTEADFFLYSLAAHLQKTGGPPIPENLPLLRLTMKKLDENDLSGLERLLPSAVAESQRKHIPLPRAAGQMILQRSVLSC